MIDLPIGAPKGDLWTHACGAHKLFLDLVCTEKLHQNTGELDESARTVERERERAHTIVDKILQTDFLLTEDYSEIADSLRSLKTMC